MATSGEGDGYAADPTVVVEELSDVDAERLAAETRRGHDAQVADARAAVVAAQAKVDKQRAHLAAAEASVTEAETALAALEGEG